VAYETVIYEEIVIVACPMDGKTCPLRVLSRRPQERPILNIWQGRSLIDRLFNCWSCLHLLENLRTVQWAIRPLIIRYLE